MDFEKHNLTIERQKLKQKLLSQDIYPGEFLEEIFENDQKGNRLAGCFENIELLLDREVSDLLKEQSPDSYFRILSLTYVHIGQAKALEGDSEKAILYFHSALAAAMQREETDINNDWVSYINGTIAYLENNLEELRKCFDEIKEMNKEVMERLYNGLKKRGEPDYKTDRISVSV